MQESSANAFDTLWARNHDKYLLKDAIRRSSVIWTPHKFTKSKFLFR